MLCMLGEKGRVQVALQASVSCEVPVVSEVVEEEEVVVALEE